MLCWTSREEIPHAQGKRNPSKTVGVAGGHQRADTLKPYSQKTSHSNHTRTTALSNSMKLSHACGATRDGRVMVERSDRMWSTGEGNGKPLQYSCLENPMNSRKSQNFTHMLWGVHGPDIPSSYAIFLFPAMDLASITSHIHTWVLFLLWLHPFILSVVISPLISSNMLGTYWPGEYLFQYPTILPFHTVHGVLKARILKWFAIPFSRGPHSVSGSEK